MGSWPFHAVVVWWIRTMSSAKHCPTSGHLAPVRPVRSRLPVHPRSGLSVHVPFGLRMLRIRALIFLVPGPVLHRIDRRQPGRCGASFLQPRPVRLIRSCFAFLVLSLDVRAVVSLKLRGRKAQPAAGHGPLFAAAHLSVFNADNGCFVNLGTGRAQGRPAPYLLTGVAPRQCPVQSPVSLSTGTTLDISRSWSRRRPG
jgi:hypothetical protein